MTIEKLLSLTITELELISNNESLLEQHLGWCLKITRPSGEKKVVKKAQKDNALENAKEIARQRARELGLGELNI